MVKIEKMLHICWQNYFDSEENVVEMELAFFIKEEMEIYKIEEVHQQRAYTEKEVLKCLKKQDLLM